MKFWQVTSIFRDEKDILVNVFSQHKEFKYLEYLNDLSDIVKKQKREILDAEIDEGVLMEVCALSKKIIYLTTTEHELYLYKTTTFIGEIPILRAVELYEHDYVEEVFEKTQANAVLRKKN
jgi:hypothetical protein